MTKIKDLTFSAKYIYDFLDYKIAHLEAYNPPTELINDICKCLGISYDLFYDIVTDYCRENNVTLIIGGEVC